MPRKYFHNTYALLLFVGVGKGEALASFET